MNKYDMAEQLQALLFAAEDENKEIEVDDEMRDIPGFEGRYAVTRDGQVWSYITHRFLTLRADKDGYLRVHLHDSNGKEKLMGVHRLVAMAYIPNPENKPTVNHKSEVKTDNRVENLQWATMAEQNAHGTRLARIGAALGKHVYCVELDQEFPSIRATCEALNLYPAGIRNCCNGKQKTCGNYHFKFISE